MQNRTPWRQKLRVYFDSAAFLAARFSCWLVLTLCFLVNFRFLKNLSPFLWPWSWSWRRASWLGSFTTCGSGCDSIFEDFLIFPCQTALWPRGPAISVETKASCPSSPYFWGPPQALRPANYFPFFSSSWLTREKSIFRERRLPHPLQINLISTWHFCPKFVCISIFEDFPLPDRPLAQGARYLCRDESFLPE